MHETIDHTNEHPPVREDKSMFQEGDIVSYGLHGRCQIIGVEEMKVAGDTKRFLNLQTSKTIGSKNQGVSARVLVPAETAKEAGVRKPLNSQAEIDEILNILEEADAYFSLDEHWKIKQKHIDEIVRLEGAKGLAKALGHLVICEESFGHVTTSDEQKYQKLIRRLLAREIAEAQNAKNTKEAEKLINRSLMKRVEELHDEE
jgi:RNA polymerase-interacting CarD/CdnL/TRCF family regulator